MYVCYVLLLVYLHYALLQSTLLQTTQYEGTIPTKPTSGKSVWRVQSPATLLVKFRALGREPGGLRVRAIASSCVSGLKINLKCQPPLPARWGVYRNVRSSLTSRRRRRLYNS